MSYTAITKPTQGDPTKKATIDAVIDDLDYLNSQLSTSVSVTGVPNGSFETDTDADGVPDGWAFTAYTGGTGVRVDGSSTTGNSTHSRYAFKFSSPGGAGNGGGYIDSSSTIDCSTLRSYVISWLMKSTSATVQIKAQVYWYKGDLSASATGQTTIYDNSTTNPSAWTLFSFQVTPPSDAKYCKLRFTGAYTSSGAGDVYFDGVSMSMMGYDALKSMDFNQAGTFNWVTPSTVTRLRVRCWGGGGGGLAYAGSTGVGGGGGEYAESFVAVSASTSYVIVVGKAGATSGNGGDTTFDSTTVVAKGGLCSAGAGVGGVGGSGGTGQILVSGENGLTPIIGNYGQGGASRNGGAGGYILTSGGAVTGGPGCYPGGGGGGGLNAGAAGRCVIEYY